MRSTEHLPAGTPSAWSLRSRHSSRQQSGAGDRGRSAIMNKQRITAGLLAASGGFFGLFAWMAPLIWPGYLVWLGWIWIACGSNKISHRWFWLISAIWNAGLLFLFLSDTDWSGSGMTFSYWYARFHLAISTFASVFLCVRLSPIINTKK